MQEVCSPARGLESHGLKAICSGAVDTTIADALDMLGCCDCVTNNLLDCVVSDMYGCYRDTLMGTGSDLGAASCIDNVLGCGGRSSMGKLSCDSSFSAFSEQDLYPGAISVCMLAEDDMEPGPARPAFAAKPEPLSLLQNSMPSLASDSPVTSESMQSEQSGVLAFVPMDQQGVDGWVPRKHSDPESPLSSSVASLSAVSSMASLSTMVHIGGAASPCDPQLLQQQQKHHADLVRAAERLGNLHNSGALPASNFCSAAPLPMCPTPRGAADAMAGPSRVSGAPSAPGVGGEGCEASGSGVRASMRPRRAAAFVPMPLAGRAKKRGSAANNTCKIAPNPNGHACTACGATQTPVWRAGPFGPKTLCNACGVRYMKVAKKK